MLTVVLCGGKGTRLGQPNKCWAEVAGTAFMVHKVANLLDLGHKDGLVFLVGQHFIDNPQPHFFNDSGTGRGNALHECQRALPDWFWLTYGDTLLSYDREAVEDAHKKSGRPVMTVNKSGVDYGAMIVPRDCWDGRPFHDVLRSIDPVPFVVDAPWHHINTPEDLAETEAWLEGRSACVS